MSYKVTKEWIVINTTKQHSEISAINSPQAKILGLEWNELVSGWRERVIGKEISNASKELFEKLIGVKGKRNQQLIINEFKKDKK